MRLPPQSQSVDRSVTMPMGIGANGVQPAFLGGILSAAVPYLKKAAVGALQGALN